MNECVICRAQMKEAFSATVLGQYNVQYLFCDSCGHLRTETPYWLDEAYSAAISAADTGIVWRNQQLADLVTATLYRHFGTNGAYLDAAGGTGLFVRLMRDIGFDFRWEDKYCENQFARFFEDDGKFDEYAGVTAFEVLEHVPEPLDFLQSLLARTRRNKLILFTTELYEGAPPPRDWWYYAFPTGQHISFYQHKTLAFMAQRLNLEFSSANGLHIFSQKAIKTKKLRRTLRNAARIRQKVVKMLSSYRDADHREIMIRLQRGGQ